MVAPWHTQEWVHTTCPPGYIVIARRDRQDGYGRVFIMAKSNTPYDELFTSKQSELLVISVGRSNNQPLIVAGFYRPAKWYQDHAEQICTEVQELVRNQYKRPILVDRWFQPSRYFMETQQHLWKSKCTRSEQCFLDISWRYWPTADGRLPHQKQRYTGLVLDKPTFTHQPPETNSRNKWSWGLFIGSDVQAKLRRPNCHNIFLWKKVDLEKLQNDNAGFLPVIYFQILNITPYLHHYWKLISI